MPSKKKVHPHMLSPTEVNRYGFEWPGNDGLVPSARVQVTRISSVERKNGLYKALNVAAEHGDELTIYITPRGRMHVFRAGVELKEGDK